MALSHHLLALQYDLRLDASPEFIQGYADGMRLDQRGQGVACGRGWIPRTKKCSRDKASQTSKEAKAKTVERAKERAKLKGEVKSAKGTKPYTKPSRPNFAYVGDRKTASPGTVFYDDPNATPEQKAWMKDQGQDYIAALIGSKREIGNIFPDVKKTAEFARSKGYEGDDYEVIARMMGGDPATDKKTGRRRNAGFQNMLPIHWEDEQPSPSKRASSKNSKQKR
ncbi:MAG: hypothetical protein RLZZ597_1987 [Cyanobacteriota bacterium]|jgi:hypothetical protein